MMNPFEYSKIICENNHLPENIDFSGYNPFMVNRILSLYPDTILYAQELNTRSEIPKEQQFKMLQILIQPKRKRWAPWPKKMEEEKEIIEALIELYKISYSKAENYINLLNDEQKKEILKLVNKGGKK